MTVVADRDRFDLPRTRRSGGRVALIVMVAASLVAGSAFRHATSDAFQPAVTNEFAASKTNTKQFDSYTLGLLLGGLRGPLVMTLWSSSEAQKGDRNLEDINTKIELIRLLQPEFDSVHLFQIWNKAYNLSVQMSNLPSKYATILDAIDYAVSIRQERPENINLESALAGVYFDKLGSANEKAYYRERLREESQPPIGQVKITFPAARRSEFVKAALAAGADPRRFTLRPESGPGDQLSARLRQDYGDRVVAAFAGPDVAVERFAPRTVGAPSQTSIRTRIDPVLDAQGNILPSLADHSYHPANDLDWPPDHIEHNELSYLTRFEPFKNGVSPFAFAYNYYKRAVSLQETKKQKHAQLSDRVISSRCALALKNWADEELELGRYAELAQFGRVAMSEDASAAPLEVPAADLPIDAIAHTPLLDETLQCYTRSAQIAAAATTELRQHLARYADDLGTYRNLAAELIARGELAAGDAAYTRLMLTPASDTAARQAVAREAANHYAKSTGLFERVVLAYYIPQSVIEHSFPKGYGKLDVVNSFEDPSTFPAELVTPTLIRALRYFPSSGEPISQEIGEYQTYMVRIGTRLRRLEPLAGAASMNVSPESIFAASTQPTATAEPAGPAGPPAPSSMPAEAPPTAVVPTTLP